MCELVALRLEYRNLIPVAGFKYLLIVFGILYYFSFAEKVILSPSRYLSRLRIIQILPCGSMGPTGHGFTPRRFC